jgi:hypothetical protein
VHGQHDDPDPRVPSEEGGRRGRPVHPGHGEVGEHHVGERPIDHREQLPPVAGLPDHLDLLRAGQRGEQPEAEHGVVVGDDHPHRPDPGRHGVGCHEPA